MMTARSSNQRGPSRPVDIRAKRRTETWLQWRSRLAHLDQNERDKAEPLVTNEAALHGDYYDDFVTHVETGTICQTKRNRQTSSMVRMYESGAMTADQFSAAMSIARIAEMIERQVGYRASSTEARVDNSASSRGMMIERLSLVRDEAAYSEWRLRIPMPRRMILDMLLVNRPLATSARVYRMSWARARQRLFDALDLWNRLRDDASKLIDQQDVDAAHARIMGEWA